MFGVFDTKRSYQNEKQIAGRNYFIIRDLLLPWDMIAAKTD